MSYPIHPVAALFPMIDGDAFAALVADIKANGLIEPIVLVGNVIVDGRNRLKACEAAGITPRYREIDVKDPVAYIISTNLHRRHLTTAQRAAIAADLATMSHGTNQHEKKHVENMEGSNDPSTITEMSIQQSAQLMNVSSPSVKRAKKRKKKDPEAHEAIKRGEKPPKTTSQAGESDDMKQKKGVNASVGWLKTALLAYQEATGELMSYQWIISSLKPFLIEQCEWVKDSYGSKNLTPDQTREIQAAANAYAQKIGTLKAGAAAQQDILTAPSSEPLQGKEITALDRAIAAHKRALDMQMEERIKERLQAALDMYVKEYDRYKEFNDAWKGFLADDEYRLIISCLHPDRAPADRVKQYEKAFHLVKSKEDILLAAKKDPRESTMPRTVAELMVRRNRH